MLKSGIVNTTLRTAGQAEFFMEAKTAQDLIKAKQISLRQHLPLLVVGGASNLAILQKEIKGLVVKNSYIKKETIKETDKYVDLSVSSGYPVSTLVNETIELGLAGFEYYKGLPGTVGGAIYMNAKWTRPLSYFGSNLFAARVLDKDAQVKQVNHDYFQFSYDFSILQKTKEILLEAVFRLPKVESNILIKRANEAFEYRKATQPYGVATSGCFFQNVAPDTSAGYLIDKAGLKGYAVGDFYVSDKHANFIVNKGNGKTQDLVKLINIIKSKVKEKFGVELKEEVVII